MNYRVLKMKNTAVTSLILVMQINLVLPFSFDRTCCKIRHGIVSVCLSFHWKSNTNRMAGSINVKKQRYPCDWHFQLDANQAYLSGGGRKKKISFRFCFNLRLCKNYRWCNEHCSFPLWSCPKAAIRCPSILRDPPRVYSKLRCTYSLRYYLNHCACLAKRNGIQPILLSAFSWNNDNRHGRESPNHVLHPSKLSSNWIFHYPHRPDFVCIWKKNIEHSVSKVWNI